MCAKSVGDEEPDDDEPSITFPHIFADEFIGIDVVAEDILGGAGWTGISTPPNILDGYGATTTLALSVRNVEGLVHA